MVLLSPYALFPTAACLVLPRGLPHRPTTTHPDCTQVVDFNPHGACGATVVASNPDVISWGATKPSGDNMSRYCCVALIGRVSVWVMGDVEIGDTIQVLIWG